MPNVRVSTRGEQPMSVDKMFANGEPQVGYQHLPKGRYEGFIVLGSWVIKEKDKGGNESQVRLKCTTEGFVGREQIGRWDLTTQVGINIFQGNLIALGFEKPRSLKEAAEMVAETDNIPVKFYVGEQKDEFPPKVSILERLETAPVADSPEPVAEVPAEPGTEEVELTQDLLDGMTADEVQELATVASLDAGSYKTEAALRRAVAKAYGL